MKYKEYKNGYLLTNEEHDLAVKHRHKWVAEQSQYDLHKSLEKSHCECGAMKMKTHLGWRIYIAMSPDREARLLQL